MNSNMNVVLRKEDGSTSVLLFLYNMLYTKTGQTGLRLASLLEIMGTFGKAESAARMALSRAGKTGLLESSRQGRDIVYSLTTQAKDYISEWNSGAACFWRRFDRRSQSWDGKWHLISLLVDDTAFKSDAAELMEELGYAQVGSGQFLGPWDVWVDLDGLLRQAGAAVHVASVSGELRTESGAEGFVESTFRLCELRALYKSFLERYSPLLEQLRTEEAREGKSSSVSPLPTLQQLGFEFFRVASKDMMLPRELYPDWEGELAAFLMRDLRLILEERSWRYLQGFL